MSASPSAGQPAAEVQMSKRPWPILLGPPLAVLVGAVLLSQLQAPAKAGRRVTPPPPVACADAPTVPIIDSRPGTWWKTQERIDAAGTLIGRRVLVGTGNLPTTRIDLAVESSVSGPLGGLVVVTSDDGQRSSARIVSATAACSWPAGDSHDVIRSAILDPADGSLLAHLVDRASRADLGIWRLPGPATIADAPVQVAPPLGSIGRTLGVVWATDLRLDAATRRLAVQSCSDTDCLTRVYSLAQPGRAPLVIPGPEQGALIGFSPAGIVTWGACNGMPCGVLGWDATTRQHRTLVDSAAAAATTVDGRFLLATDGRTGATIRLDLRSGALDHVGVRSGERPLELDGNRSQGLEVAADEVAVALPGGAARRFRPASAEVLP
jgi:hypothetical protein